MEGLAKIGGPIIAFGLIGYGIYHWASENPQIIATAVYIFIAVVVAIIFWLFIYPNLKAGYVYNAAPLDGPMLVKIRGDLHAPSGRKPVWRLHVDVRMSRKDQDALRQSGMETYQLFQHPHPSFPDEQTSYCYCHLFNTPYVDFPDIQQMSKAKDDLITGLHTLRSRLDQNKEHIIAKQTGANTETFEI